MSAQSRLERQAAWVAVGLHACSKRIPQCEVNLGDNYPDSPGSAVAGSGGQSTSSPVERAVEAGTLADRAVVDWARLKEVYRQLDLLTAEAYNLTGFWCFDHRPGTEKESTPLSDERWCTSCLRAGRTEPRSREDLCDWCYRYKKGDGNNEIPPLPLVMLLAKRRREGKRVYDRDIKLALKDSAGPAMDRRNQRAKAKR